MNRGKGNELDVSEGLKAGHVKYLQERGKTQGQIAVIVANTDYSCSTTIDYPLLAFQLGKGEAKILKAMASTKMMLLVAVSKESEAAFLRAKIQIGHALRKALRQRTRMVRMLTKSSGAAETDNMLQNMINNLRIHHALASVTMLGYPMVDKFHDLFKLRLVDPNTGLPSELSNELSLRMIILNEKISRDKPSGKERFLAYAAMRSDNGIIISFYLQDERRTLMEAWKRLAPAHVFFHLISRYWALDILSFLNQVFAKAATEFFLEQASFDGTTVTLAGDDDCKSKDNDAAYCDFELSMFENMTKDRKTSTFDLDVRSMGSVYAAEPENETPEENEAYYPLNTCARDIIAEAQKRLDDSSSAKTPEEVQIPLSETTANPVDPVTLKPKSHAQVPPFTGTGPTA